MRALNRTIPALFFAILLGTAGAVAAPLRSPTVRLAHNAKYGTILVTPKGMTLYYFTVDKPNKSNCFGSCAHIWPPFMLPKGMKAPVKPSGLKGTLGSIPRGGGRQVTYDRRPLYTYFKDKKPGQTHGEGIGHVWFVAKDR